MSGSTGETPPTPAWKKLGLKLKHSKADEAANGPPAVGQPGRAQQGSGMQGKRKMHAGGAVSDYSSPVSAKKPRRDLDRSSTGDATPQLKKKKSVAFADTPSNKTAAPGSTTARKTPAKPLPNKNNKTKSPTPKKQKRAQPTADTKPALEYLRHWVSSRDSWKFNKNHQSTLIKAVFESGLPPADIGSFYDYIDDIKGAVRMRLRETALAIRLKDRTDRAAGFPDNTADAEGKQEIYEAAIAGFLEAQEKVASKKRTFAEIDYVTTSQDADVIIRRLVKRMRAEMVIATLSDGDETDVSTTSTRMEPRAAKTSLDNTAANKIKTNGLTGKRRRKMRTNMEDSDGSSDSSSSSDSDSDDSDSDSDTSSSGSDSSSADEADDDENMDNDSSSSSSSSSDDDSDDEDSDSDDEATVSSSKGEKASK